MVKGVFKGSGSYNTPDKKGMRIADIIYGSGTSQDRSAMNSR